jgi:hypothetical protein
MGGYLSVALIATAGILCGAEPLVDEGLRIRILRALFPEMAVSLAPERSIDYTWTTQTRAPLVFPDALASENVYNVGGPPSDDLERCAAQDMLSRHASETREVRFRVFPWPASNRGEILAIVQYRFSEAKPAGSCRSIAFLVRLAPSNGKWEVRERFLLNGGYLHQLESIRWINLTSSGYQELVVESDLADGDRLCSNAHILNLALGRFEELLVVPTRVHVSSKGETWTQTLDIPNTLKEHGQRFCFVKTVYAVEHHWFPIPSVSVACYGPGDWTVTGDHRSFWELPPHRGF